jgi:hypothetical protein
MPQVDREPLPHVSSCSCTSPARLPVKGRMTVLHTVRQSLLCRALAARNRWYYRGRESTNGTDKT